MKESYAKRQGLIFVFLLIFLVIGVVSLYIGINTKKAVTLSYKENNDIDYKVYLKENDYFDQEYLEKGKTYITSLIDHINVTFNYNIDFSEEVDVAYKYRVVAKIEANKTDNEAGNYWTKDFDITKDVEQKLDNVRKYSIMQNINIDYNKYNDLLNSFKKSVGLSSSDGVLKVYLVIDSNVDGESISTPISSNLILKLPLSELAIEATIDSDVSNNVKEVKEMVKVKGLFYTILVIVGCFCTILSIFLAIVLLRSRRLYKSGYKYDLEIDKIMSTYDSIIVNIKDLPDLEGYSVIKVETFEELIDAHSEIRKPINYYKTRDGSIFFLLSDNVVWKYALYKKRRRR